MLGDQVTQRPRGDAQELAGGGPVAAGLVAGLAASLALSRSLASLLYEVRARDTATYVIVSLVIMAAAVASAYLPARRASRVDPMTALRAE